MKLALAFYGIMLALAVYAVVQAKLFNRSNLNSKRRTPHE